MPSAFIYHICKLTEWNNALSQGAYPGSSQDAADGFIHFSSGHQVMASAAKHRARQEGLVLLTVDPLILGKDLRWEPARGGELFPHLYGPLPTTAVKAVDDLPLDDNGMHVFPTGFSEPA